MKFSVYYSMFSRTQKHQNAKLFKIMFEKLKNSRWVPEKILDVGCGDGVQTLFLAKSFPYAEVVGIDISSQLVGKARSLLSKSTMKNVRFICTDYFDYKETDFDVVVSNNTFHWFGNRAVEGYRKLSYHLRFGGWFFIHQGGRWSYIALRYLMERMLRERGIEPPSYPLFYPTKRHMKKLLSALPLRGEVEKVYERDQDDRQVYIDFTYAGGLPYINLLETEEEKEEFRREFVRRCIEEECPSFPVRLYIYGRNIAGVSYEHFPEFPDILYGEQIRKLLEEVNEEFVPPLSTRTNSTDNSLSMRKEGRGIDPYYQSIKSQENILALEGDRVLGLLSFVREFPFKDKKWVYVSTIAVRKQYRNLGLGKGLYSYLLNLFPSDPILTRTWTGNDAHTNLLTALGFKEVERMKDHRGKGIDTIYFGKVK